MFVTAKSAAACTTMPTAEIIAPGRPEGTAAAVTRTGSWRKTQPKRKQTPVDGQPTPARKVLESIRGQAIPRSLQPLRPLADQATQAGVGGAARTGTVAGGTNGEERAASRQRPYGGNQPS
ncbi:hypothetical protein JCM9533A_01120 [Catenuloplanes niger JCM 9533]